MYILWIYTIYIIRVHTRTCIYIYVYIYMYIQYISNKEYMDAVFWDQLRNATTNTGAFKT